MVRIQHLPLHRLNIQEHTDVTVTTFWRHMYWEFAKLQFFRWQDCILKNAICGSHTERLVRERCQAWMNSDRTVQPVGGLRAARVASPRRPGSAVCAACRLPQSKRGNDVDQVFAFLSSRILANFDCPDKFQTAQPGHFYPSTPSPPTL